MRDDSSVKLRWGAIVAIVLYLTWAWQGSTLCVNLAGTSDPSRLSLADLSNLKIDKSNATSDLLTQTYWNSVSAAYGTSILQIIPNTIIGLINSSADWRNWAFRNIPSPPLWFSSGITQYMEEQFFFLRAKALATNNATLAALVIKGLAASIAGYTLAPLDFVLLNGITALRIYLETGNLVAAFCSTSPSQLGVLYNQAFASNVPREMRAQYLGNALALTTVIIVLAGKDGFAPKFQVALNRVGLADAWGTIKPYLSRIGGAVSARASMLTFAILEKIAQRFPQDSTWATGLTADRIDSMVEVLHDKGVTNDEIQNDITHVAQAASNSPTEDGAASVADAISYQDGGGIKVRLRSENKMVLYDDGSGRTQSITAKFLGEKVTGFDPQAPGFITIHYRELDVNVYHYYPGPSGTGAWIPVVPDNLAKPGDVFTVSFDLLTRDGFVKNLPKLALGNYVGVSWVADLATITDYSLAGDQFVMRIVQEPTVQGDTSFLMSGTAGPLQSVGGDTFLKISLPDAVNEPETLKITFNGYDRPRFSIQSGSNFSPVSLFSSDGVRLRIVSNSGGSAITVTTLYLQEPSALYSLGDMTAGSDYGIQGVSNAYQIEQVTTVRQLENSMVGSSKYDLARLGAEITFTVGKKDFGLDNLVLEEPSAGGADLHTADWTTLMQARFLNVGNPTPDVLASVLQQNLDQMVGKLAIDFQHHLSTAKAGYAVLSYASGDGKITTIILFVPGPAH